MQCFDRIVGLAVVALCIAFLGACSVAGPDPAGDVMAMVAPYPPPPERAEIPPSPPSTDALWQGGHWSWKGVNYIWIRGSYLRRPTPTANWMPGYWDQDPCGWIWTDGHWQS